MLPTKQPPHSLPACYLLSSLESHQETHIPPVPPTCTSISASASPAMYPPSWICPQAQLLHVPHIPPISPSPLPGPPPCTAPCTALLPCAAPHLHQSAASPPAPPTPEPCWWRQPAGHSSPPHAAGACGRSKGRGRDGEQVVVMVGGGRGWLGNGRQRFASQYCAVACSSLSVLCRAVLRRLVLCSPAPTSHHTDQQPAIQAPLIQAAPNTPASSPPTLTGRPPA